MIQSVERAFSIIEILSDDPLPQPLSTISAKSELAPATTHRFLDTLCQLGYVKNDSNGRYLLTLKLFNIAGGAIKQNSLVSIAQGYLTQLSEKVHETVHLMLRDGNEVVYVFKSVQVIGAIQMASHIGTRFPMYCTAGGKAILSTLPASEVLSVFNSSNVRRLTEKTITSPEELLRQMDEVRKNGYALDHEENEDGIICIGMPLGIDPTSVRYAFSVSSLATRFTPDRIAEVVVEMRRTKQLIENELANI